MESSYYPLVICIELPFYSLCKEFIIITGLVVENAIFLTTPTNTKIHLISGYKSLANHLEDIGTMQSSKPVLNTKVNTVKANLGVKQRRN